MQINELKITEIKPKPFKGSEGNMIPYFWVKGETEDGVTYTFGSKKNDFKVGEVMDVNLEKNEKGVYKLT